MYQSKVFPRRTERPRVSTECGVDPNFESGTLNDNSLTQVWLVSLSFLSLRGSLRDDSVVGGPLDRELPLSVRTETRE